MTAHWSSRSQYSFAICSAQLNKQLESSSLAPVQEAIEFRALGAGGPPDTRGGIGENVRHLVKWHRVREERDKLHGRTLLDRVERSKNTPCFIHK